MDYEKMYKESLGRAIFYKENADGVGAKDVSDIIEGIFPKLKESDDKIREKLLSAFKSIMADADEDELWYGLPYNDIIAWLEKQGESDETKAKTFLINKGYPIDTNSVFPTYEEMYNIIREGLEKQSEQNKWKPSKDEMDALYGLSYITNKMDDKKDEAITKLYQDLKREFFDGASYENMFPSSPVDAPIKDEKQTEQKPTDKVEPKFNVGDWVKHNTANFVFQIVGVGIYGYTVLNKEGHTWTVTFDNEGNYHLWTITDAKDGDVLVEDSCIFIIQKLGDNSTAAKTYFTLYNDGDFDDGSILYFDIDSTKPATKEQCDTLEMAMTNAGYRWNKEELKLEKI